jgi:Recombinase
MHHEMQSTSRFLYDSLRAMSGKRRRRRTKERRRQHRPSTERTAVSPTATPEAFKVADRVERLAYTRRQAAEALGISVATLDRRIVPALTTVKTPSGMRLIPVAELERFLAEHAQVASVEFSPRRRAGRPPSVRPDIVERIRREHAEGRSLGEIAGGLTASGVPTSQGGRRWWPSTVRTILARSRSQS